MASYDELAQLYAEKALRPKISVAIAISAYEIMTESDTVLNHTDRYAWAARALKNPNQEADRFLIGILSAYSNLATSLILGATDTQIKNAVSQLIDIFAINDTVSGV